jgi:sigma-E factor negative regulatory protein RseB
MSLIWLAFSFSAQAQETLSATDWLDKMSRASRQLDYFGIFSYEHGASNQTLRIFHVVRDGVEYERLMHMDGEPNEIIRKGHPVDCIHNGESLMRSDSRQIRRNLSDRFGGDFQELQSYYQIALAGEERVAGRRAVKLIMQANDDYRHSYVLSIDANTGLLLRSLMHDSQGRILERFQFSIIAAGVPIEANMLEAETANPTIINNHHDLTSTVDGAKPEQRLVDLLQFQWLPRGFVKVESLQPGFESLTFSDGLAVFTVYLERLAAEAGDIDGWAQQGGTMALSRRLSPPLEEVVLTIVGELPPLTLERLSAGARVVLPALEPSQSPQADSTEQ